jgi:transglutaminase-like putative cysteine protease
MFIRLGYEWLFNVPSPTPALLKLYLHPSEDPKVVQPDRLQIEPETPLEEFIDQFGNRAARIILPPGRIRIWNEAVVEDTGHPDPVCPEAQQHPISELPLNVLPYLLSSRYCEVDRLSDIAWELFGKVPRGWARAQAVCDWVHDNIQFGYEHARVTKTAYETYVERTGVCRDFMHLAATFCRCLHIPARCKTGYLGDIGVPVSPTPMDFISWFEVYLDHQWHTFDARYNVPRIGRILMARGYDAVDVALTTSFGPIEMVHLTVLAEEIPPML